MQSGGEVISTGNTPSLEAKAVASRKFLITLCAAHPGQATQLLLAKTARPKEESAPKLTQSVLIRQKRAKLEDTMDPYARVNGGSSLTVADICAIAARKYNLTLNELLSNRRTKDVVHARQIAMYLCKVLTRKSFPHIGRCIGDRDHTTVLHAVRRVTERMASDEKFEKEISDFAATLTQKEAA